MWLLIAKDMAGGGAACEIGVEATAAAYGTPFDRVFWFEVIEGQATELRRRD